MTSRIEPDKSAINFSTQKLKSRQHSDSQYIPEPYKNIASGYETQFAKLMIDQMKKTIPEAENESSADDFYNDVLNTERAKVMAQQNEGLGLQQLILDQIYPKRLRNEITYQNFIEKNKPRNYGQPSIGTPDATQSISIKKGNENEQ